MYAVDSGFKYLSEVMILYFAKELLFVLGADEYLERLEGKIRKCLFFMLKYSKITVCCMTI